MTTKDIIKIMPFEPAYKLELLTIFDTLDVDVRIEVERSLWKAYRELYKIHRDANLQLAFKRVADDQEVYDQNFYKRVQDKTKADIQRLSQDSLQQVDLDAARKAMEMIINEMRASKLKIKN